MATAKRTTRKPASNGAATNEAIRKEALELIYKTGYEAANLRTLARKVGLQVASLYNYFDNKEELLVFIIKTSFEQRLARLELAIEEIEDPYEALCAFVVLCVKVNTQFKQETVIGDRELIHLPKKALAEVIALRDKFDTKVTRMIESGVKRGVFKVTDARITAFALIGMMMRIASWYRPSGRLSADDLTKIYMELALRIVGADPVPPA